MNNWTYWNAITTYSKCASCDVSSQRRIQGSTGHVSASPKNLNSCIRTKTRPLIAIFAALTQEIIDKLTGCEHTCVQCTTPYTCCVFKNTYQWLPHGDDNWVAWAVSLSAEGSWLGQLTTESPFTSHKTAELELKPLDGDYQLQEFSQRFHIDRRMASGERWGQLLRHTPPRGDADYCTCG